MILRLLCLVLVLLLPLPGRAGQAVDDDAVRVQRHGDGWLVEASFFAPVPPRLAWAVLTDFDGMERILTNLESSRIVSRQGNLLRVEQKGVARFGPASFAFESLREMQLYPEQRIVARGISGSTRQFESDMRLSPENEGTRFTYRAEMVPDFWFPSFIGPKLLRHELAEQFSAMVEEMQRRARPAAK